MRTYLTLGVIVMIGAFDVVNNRGEAVRVVGKLFGGGLQALGFG